MKRFDSAGSAESSRRSRIAAAAALASTGLLALLYVLALGTHFGHVADEAAFPLGLSDRSWLNAASVIGDSANVLPVLLFAAVLMSFALATGRAHAGFAAVLVLAGSIATTEVLKEALGGLDLTGGEAERTVGRSYFPSGHATSAMALALGAVLVAPGARRWVVTIPATTYVALAGVALVVEGAHYPGDVVGGFLVAAAWAALAVAILTRHWPRTARRRASRMPPASSSRPSAASLAAYGALVCLPTMPLLISAIDGVTLDREHQLDSSFLAGASVVTVVAVFVIAGIAALAILSETYNSVSK